MSADNSSTVICLDYIPLNKHSRQKFARKYSIRNYSHHREYYQLDCELKTAALLKTTQFYGKKTRHQKNIDGAAEVIIPGTALDIAATSVCKPPARQAVEQDESRTETMPDKLIPPQSTPISQELQDSIREYSRLAKAEPANIKHWIDLGNACYDAEMGVEAIEAYDQALKLKPDDVDILNNQGTMYRTTGKTELALVNFEKALKIAPDNLESLYNIGYIHAIVLSNKEKALAAWKRYLELDKNSETSKQLRQFMEKYQTATNDGNQENSTAGN